MTTAPMKVNAIDWTGCYDGSWRGLITDESFAHPAKFARGLIERIVRHGLEQGWWRPGDLLADPFGGIGTGGLACALAGLRWVGVELEPRFCAMAEANFALNERPMFPGEHPTPVIIQGDSRRFAEIIQASGIVTSPPYVSGGHHADQTGSWGGQLCQSDHRGLGSKDAAGYGATPGQIGKLPAGEVESVITSPPYAELGGGGPDHQPDRLEGSSASVKMNRDSYGSTPGQIGRLKEGQLDAVVSSPPYAETEVTGDRNFKSRFQPERPGAAERVPGYGAADGQIGALKQGSVDAVISSPPYAESVKGDHAERETPDESWKARSDLSQGGSLGKSQRHGGYGAEAGNIGNLKEGDLDGVVTSPPWVDSVGSSDRCLEVGDLPLVHGGRGEGGTLRPTGRQGDYGSSEGQLGAADPETYWLAMRAVYGQCLLALRPGGYMAVVIKDYVKKGQRVPLCEQTLALLIHCGFEPVQRIRAHLTQTIFENGRERVVERKSFFRRLAEKKGSPRIDWEEVLIVRKRSDGASVEEPAP